MMTPLTVDFALAFVKALPAAAIVVERDLRIVAFNPPATALLPALTAGHHLVHVLRAPDVLDSVRRVAQSRRPETVTWRMRQPIEQAFEVHCAALVFGSPEAIGVLLSLNDITEAVRVDRLRSDFIANASHELRTPLASLLGFIETLQGAARDDTRARENFLEIMRGQGQRMARLIDDLLSLSRIEQKEHVRPADAIDLVAIVRHVADTLTHLVRDSGLALRIEAPAPVVVTGDRDELLRVVENLIENALKYAAPSERAEANTVDVTVGIEGRHGFVSVRDHGPGIDAQHLPRLTERFYRVDAGASRAKGGAGLGLAIVKHTLARHRGRLEIESTLGEGATFTAYIALLKP